MALTMCVHLSHEMFPRPFLPQGSQPSTDLQVEEQLLQEMLKRAQQEEAAEQRQQRAGNAAGAAGTGRRHGGHGPGFQAREAAADEPGGEAVLE